MNVWKTMVMVGATLALSASAASATFDRSLPSKAPHVKGAKVAKVTHHRKATTKSHVTTKRSGGGVVMIIGSPLPAGSQPAYDPSHDCEYSGNNCTDQQLCDLWGMNCDLIPAVQPTSAVTENQNPTG